MEKWYIGQPIVAVKNHQQGKFKKGDEFIIKGLRKSMCRCFDTEIDIGIKSIGQINICGICNLSYPHYGDVHWFSEINFAPLDVDISELTEILELQNS